MGDANDSEGTALLMQFVALASQVPEVATVIGEGGERIRRGATADEVVGWPADRGRALLDRLLAWSTEPQFTLRHTWRVGDLVLWDNTGMLHRAMPFEPSSVRLMHRTTLQGEEPVASA